jgi:hypothetical protein
MANMNIEKSSQIEGPTVKALLILTTVAALFAAPLSASATTENAEARDHRSILAMAGDYDVTFNMRETVAFQPGYKLLAPTRTGGHESIRVVEDKPGHVVLQHLLVADLDDKTILVVKHWRQDWTYQPKTVLTYVSEGHWKTTPVSATDSAGAWSQTVWETDDSPRYGGVGKWTYTGGVASWESRTRRPLARRDATRKPPYDWYEGLNRQSLTPTGWVHEQENAKLGLKDGKPVTYVHEVVLNIYDRFTGYNTKAADDYWAQTKGYWAGVRGVWDQAIARQGGVAVPEDREYGSVTGQELMNIPDGVQDGSVTTAAAIGKARDVIMTTASKP